jgi:hypothetical protein
MIAPNGNRLGILPPAPVMPLPSRAEPQPKQDPATGVWHWPPGDAWRLAWRGDESADMAQRDGAWHWRGGSAYHRSGQEAPGDDRTAPPVDATPAVDVGALRDRAEAAEDERDEIEQAHGAAVVERDALAGLLAELYRAYRVRFPAVAHTCRTDVATCERCDMEERVEAALRAAGLGGPGDTEPPRPVHPADPCDGCGLPHGDHNDEDRADCAEILRQIAESEAEEIATHGHVRQAPTVAGEGGL